MARRAHDGPVGDPAFRDDDHAQLTHEPIREEERGRGAARPAGDRFDLGRPETYVWPGVALVLAGLAAVAGFTAGWAYTIPFAVFGALVVVFFGGHGAIARWRQRRYGGVEPARRAVQEDPGDAVPNVDFGERAEEPDREPAGSDSPHEPHADPRHGTGRR